MRTLVFVVLACLIGVVPAAAQVTVTVTTSSSSSATASQQIVVPGQPPVDVTVTCESELDEPGSVMCEDGDDGLSVQTRASITTTVCDASGCHTLPAPTQE